MSQTIKSVVPTQSGSIPEGKVFPTNTALGFSSCLIISIFSLTHALPIRLNMPGEKPTTQWLVSLEKNGHYLGWTLNGALQSYFLSLSVHWSGKLLYLPFCPHLQCFSHLPLSWGKWGKHWRWGHFSFQWENRRKLPHTHTYLHLHPDTMDELCSRLHPSLNQEFCSHQSSLSVLHLNFSFYHGSFSWA